MAEKIQSSGFDNNIKNNTEAEDKFIKECSEKFGIKIERCKMNANKGRRTQAKLMLNNFGGDFHYSISDLRNALLLMIQNNPEIYKRSLNSNSKYRYKKIASIDIKNFINFYNF